MSNINPSSNTGYFVLIVLAVFSVVGLIFLLQPREEDNRFVRATEDISQGLENAGDELKSEKTAGEEIDEIIEDAGDGIKNSIDR